MGVTKKPDLNDPVLRAKLAKGMGHNYYGEPAWPNFFVVRERNRKSEETSTVLLIGDRRNLGSILRNCDIGRDYGNFFSFGAISDNAEYGGY
jgi:hypothetical protein